MIDGHGEDGEPFGTSGRTDRDVVEVVYRLPAILQPSDDFDRADRRHRDRYRRARTYPGASSTVLAGKLLLKPCFRFLARPFDIVCDRFVYPFIDNVRSRDVGNPGPPVSSFSSMTSLKLRSPFSRLSFR